jgi:hypothetical protein
MHPFAHDVVLTTYFIVDKTRNRHTLDGHYFSTKVQ